MGNNTICYAARKKRKMPGNNSDEKNQSSSSNYNDDSYDKSIKNNIANKRYTFSEPKSVNFVVHKNDGMNDYIIEMTLSKFDKKNNIKAEFIMILDVSGSMENYVHNLVANIIPRGLNLLNYKDDEYIHLITFESNVNSYDMKVGELKKNSSIQGSGGTYMAKVYNFVKSILNENQNQKNFRILALSDGIISDQDETKNEAEILKTFLDVWDFSISVGAIRYNSGWGGADTKAISSVLILNTDNTKRRVLTEVSHSDTNEVVAQKIYELFKDDYFESDFTLKSDKIKFRLDPWKEGKNEVKLNKGRNVIFADKNPTVEDVGIFEEGKLKYTKNDFKNGYKMTYSNYNALLGAKINMTARKVRINKTSGSKAALEENKKIIDYFENFEKNLSGNKDKETEIAKELKKSNELDIAKYNNEQLAQFIGVDNNMIPMSEFLQNVVQRDEKDENNIQEFVNNVMGDAIKIDDAFNKLFPS